MLVSEGFAVGKMVGDRVVANNVVSLRPFEAELCSARKPKEMAKIKLNRKGKVNIVVLGKVV
jgi:hypothetical protein